jgi:hypothetical protein
MPKFQFDYPEGSHISLFKIVEASRPGGDKFYIEGACDSDDVSNLPGEDEDVCTGSKMIVEDQSKTIVYSEKDKTWNDWNDAESNSQSDE